MKKLLIFLLSIGMFLSFNINILNVKAENETGTENGEGTGGETGSGTGETEGGSGDTDPAGQTGESGNESGEETTSLKSDATLKNITINGVKVICSDKYVCEYIVNNNDITTAKVVYELTNSNATVDTKSGFTKELKEGENKFEVKVTSEDKSKSNTYKFIITKNTMSTDSTLKRLVVNGTEITLNENELKYKTTVSFTTKKIEIEAIPTSDKATVVDFKSNKASFDFFENSKDVKIKVKSEAGDMVTYTVTVTKRSEADVTLKSLTIKNHEIEFDSEVTDYELKVLKNVDKLDIKAVAASKNANVKITNPKLVVGENEVKIEVSNDGNTNTYIIKVTKLNEDDKTLANLKSLEIDNYEIDFKPDKYEYTLKIENENYLVINAIAKLEDADVEITGNLDLEDGSIIKIKVTYDDEFYNVYKINIEKLGGSLITRNKISKKAVIAVILFDILSGIIIGIVQFMNKIKNKSQDKEIEVSRRNNKKVIDEDIIDII